MTENSFFAVIAIIFFYESSINTQSHVSVNRRKKPTRKK